MGSDPRAADISTYNSFALPLAIIYCLLLAVSPFSKRQPFSLPGWTKTVLPILSGVALLGFGLFYLVLDAGLVFGFIFTAAIGGLLIFLLKPEMLRALIPGVVAFFVAIFSAVRKSPVTAATLILGDMSIQGNIKAVRSLAEPLQLGMDNGARRALIPIENKRNFLDVSFKCPV